MLRYLKFPTLCDITFGVFLLSWLITRHILFILVIVSTFVDVPKVLPYAWIPEEGVWFTRQVYIAFVSMLISLQVRFCCLASIQPAFIDILLRFYKYFGSPRLPRLLGWS